jgi:hypothetical protein
MSVAPQDIAGSRFKPIRQAQQRVAKAEAALARSVARREELRHEIGPAERRDQESLGQAIVDGKAEPASEAPKAKEELAEEERRAEALALAVDRARSQVKKVVAEHRAAWRRDGMKELSRAHVRYQAAITELEAARDALSDEAALVVWLDGGAGASAASDPLGGRIGRDAQGRAPMSFARVLDELRRDGEAIAAHPVTRDDAAEVPRLGLAWRG